LKKVDKRTRQLWNESLTFAIFFLECLPYLDYTITYQYSGLIVI